MTSVISTKPAVHRIISALISCSTAQMPCAVAVEQKRLQGAAGRLSMYRGLEVPAAEADCGMHGQCYPTVSPEADHSLGCCTRCETQLLLSKCACGV